MRTLKLLTITTLVGILSVSTLNAKEHYEKTTTKVKHERQYQEVKQDSRIKKDLNVKDKRASRANTNSRYHQTSPKKGFQKKLHNKKRFHSKKNAVKVLKRGDRGHKVKVLQRSLKQRGFYRGRIDGVFGKGLKRAVKKFQRNHRIYPNGVASKKTLRLLRLR
ncbi:MAG: Unknown protein [uncultured Sulfurovum sp.]|uniref:Peptidoglycan binding-like domain-containing protein n=1 Tax=uncultured Sulfurovum sp. TaxID=269237 RepID=A0A6S6TAU9_9BACT|nr:MAG: Unknown protein [uncultured Sulfurovum sp.]